MNDSTIRFIIARLLNNAHETIKESSDNSDDKFLQGKKLAYYEMLDILKNELDIDNQDLSDFGLNIDLENEIL